MSSPLVSQPSTGTGGSPFGPGAAVSQCSTPFFDHSLEEPWLITSIGPEADVVQHQPERFAPGSERFLGAVQRREMTGELAAAEVRAMEALPLLHTPLKHAKVFHHRVRSLVLVVLRLDARLVARSGQQRCSVDAVGDVLQDEAVPLRAILPLRPSRPAESTRYGANVEGSLIQPLDRARRDFALNLIATDAHESIRRAV